ncbi:hypothetical protein AB7714_28235 [Tardiphaga sp. 1201_B9_N1_1]|uniref:hypothetical protein n=1 Tax=unclassified Tardiphaga TaxID=2631404 RepID=UPI003F20F994
MAVDLGDYTPALKAGLKKAGFACVYVASAGKACRVGYALDLPAAIKRLQRSSPVPIEVEDAVWVPDRGIATNIAQSVLAGLASHRSIGGWHNLPAASVAGEVGLTTFKLYPGATAMPHQELLGKWERRI